jgi:hypothetical protein
MSADFMAMLPAFASYEGDEPSLAHLRGVLLATTDIENVIPVGEREAVTVTDQNGCRWYPWKGVAINGPDDALGYKNAPPLPTFGPRAMNTFDLALLGFTDADLDDMAHRLLGESWQPDRVGKSDQRRDVFDRVMKAGCG